MNNCRIKTILDKIGPEKLKWVLEEKINLVEDNGNLIPTKIIELYLRDKEKEDDK